MESSRIRCKGGEFKRKGSRSMTNYKSIGWSQGSTPNTNTKNLYIRQPHRQLSDKQAILHKDPNTNLTRRSLATYKGTPINGNVINSRLELVKNWCSQNKLTLNLSKTSYIVLKIHQNQNSLKNKSIKIGGIYLNEKKTQ